MTAELPIPSVGATLTKGPDRPRSILALFRGLIRVERTESLIRFLQGPLEQRRIVLPLGPLDDRPDHDAVGGIADVPDPGRLLGIGHRDRMRAPAPPPIRGDVVAVEAEDFQAIGGTHG